MLLRVATILLLGQVLPVAAQSTGSNSGGAHDLSPVRGAVIGNGLETHVLFVGAEYADKKLTLSVRITNTVQSAAYLALVGPDPRAVDSGGGVCKIQRHLTNLKVSDARRV